MVFPLLMALFLVNTAHASSHPSVVINEVMYKPSWKEIKSDDCKIQQWFEWVELYNPSDEVVDLSGWTILDSGGSDELSGQIEPKDYAVVAAKKVCFMLSFPSFSGNLISLGSLIGRYGLGDLGDSIVIKNQDFVEADKKDYSEGAVSSAGVTLGKFDQVWKEAEPTPGAVNKVAVVVLSEEEPEPQPIVKTAPKNDPAPAPVLGTSDQDDQTEEVAELEELGVSVDGVSTFSVSSSEEVSQKPSDQTESGEPPYQAEEAAILGWLSFPLVLGGLGLLVGGGGLLYLSFKKELKNEKGDVKEHQN